MASLRKFPGSPYFFACYTDAHGKRRQVSTKQTERNKAERAAFEYARAAKLGRAGTATEAQFRKILSETLEAVTGGEETLRSTVTRTYFNDWLVSKEATKTAGTHSRYSSTVKQFLELLGDRADKPLTALRPADFQKFYDARVKAGRSSGTLDVDMKTLRTAMERARRQGLVPSNPVEAVELPGRLSQQSRELFTKAEVDMLLKAAEGTEWETVIFFGAFTAQRLSDCISVRWADVNLTNGTLVVVQGKTKTELTAPLHSRLLAHLEAKAGVDEAPGYVTPKLAGMATSGRAGLSRQFAELMRKAGVDRRLKAQASGREFASRTFHSLRHTANSILADAGVSQELRMKLTGHRSTKVNDAYTKHGVEKLREAVEKL